MNSDDRLALIERLREHRVESGLLNCHLPDLHSIILDRRDDGSLLRIFYAAPGHRLYRIFQTDGSFVLGAHNHDKPLSFSVLHGDVWNVGVSPWETGSDYLKYPFLSSALETGAFQLGPPVPVRAALNLRPLDGHTMATYRYHTVMVASMTASWLVDEGQQQKHVLKWLLSPVPITLSVHGLYVPMAKTDLAEHCDAIASAMEVMSE